MRRLAVLLVCACALPVSAARAWTWPVDGPVLRPFSFDHAHPYAGGQHRGVDLGAPGGTRGARSDRGNRLVRGNSADGREDRFDRDAARVHRHTRSPRHDRCETRCARRRRLGGRNRRPERRAGAHRALCLLRPAHHRAISRGTSIRWCSCRRAHAPRRRPRGTLRPSRRSWAPPPRLRPRLRSRSSLPRRRSPPNAPAERVAGSPAASAPVAAPVSARVEPSAAGAVAEARPTSHARVDEEPEAPPSRSARQK